MNFCPICRKPYYRFDGTTTTLTSTVWPYCQCTQFSTLRFTITNSTAMTGWGEITRERVPQAFQDAFKDEELQI